MRQANFGAVRPFATAAVLALFAVSVPAQVVEKGRTLADLIASHPCDTGLTNRIARVTDCDSATDFGDGDGAFQCWAYCDGSAPWTNLSIGGGGGGGEATSVQGSATLPATCTELDLYQDTNSGGTEFYVCTATNTWTKAGTGDGTIGGSTGATDDALVCADGTGGATVGACTVGNLDNLRLDGNTISSTDANGNIVLAPNGTGRVIVPHGSLTAPGISVPGNNATGFHIVSGGTESLNYIINGVPVLFASAARVRIPGAAFFGWIPATNTEANEIDTSLHRQSAGVVRCGDGSTGIRCLLGGGTAIASATALPVPTGRVFHVTGTTNITSITATNLQSGVCVTLIFDDALTFTDGSNLKLDGDFVTTADDSISLCYDGTSWFETSRSVN